MFGKLMKYELRSYWRVFLPLWGALLALSVVNSFTLQLGNAENMSGLALFFSFMLPLMLLIFGVMATLVLALVLVLQRFYRGLLGQEGYLMFTLPVNVPQLIGSKLLSAVIVELLSAVVAFACVMIIISLQNGSAFVNFTGELGRMAIEAFRRMPSETMSFALTMAELLLIFVFAAALETLHLYAAMALGHLISKHRIAASVGAYIVINMLLSSLTMIFNVKGATELVERALDSLAGLNSLLGVGLLAELVFCAALWAVSQLTLSHRLNLE